MHKCAKVCAHIAHELVPPLIRHLAISRHQGCPAPTIIDLRTKSVTKAAICRETSQRWKDEQKTCEKTCARCNISRNARLIQSAWDAIQLLRTKNTFLFFMFFSNARALFLKRLAGPPSYLEYAVGYPHCGLLSFHLCLQVTKQHVAKLIDQLTVIPSEFQTR